MTFTMLVLVSSLMVKWYHEDYYAFLLLERIFGDYQIDKHGSAHVNNAKKQYRLSEPWLSHKMSP